MPRLRPFSNGLTTRSFLVGASLCLFQWFLPALYVPRLDAAEGLVIGDISTEHFDVEHQVVQEDKHLQIRMMELFPRGESVDKWTELITIQSLGRKHHPSPRAAVDGTKQMLTQRCPGVKWNEIGANDEDIVYEWHIENCAPQADQQEIARYFATRSTVYRVAYTVKNRMLSAEERDRWLGWLRAAHINK